MTRTRARWLIFLPMAVGLTLWLTQLVWLYATGRDYAPVNLLRIGSFPFNDETGTLNDVPPAQRALDGKRVVVDGMMYSGMPGPRTGQFQLIYNIQTRRAPPVQQRIFATTRGGATVPMYDLLVRAYGTIHLRIARDADGFITRLYQMDVDRVEPDLDSSRRTLPERAAIVGSGISLSAFVLWMIALLYWRCKAKWRLPEGTCPRVPVRPSRHASLLPRV